MTNIVRYPYIGVTVAGGTLTDVLAARVQAGYDLRVAQAEVICRALPAGAVPWANVTITLGGNAATAAKRFDGYFVEPAYSLLEYTVTLVCKGTLQRAATFEAQTEVDMTSFAVNDPLGLPYGHKDEVMVSTVLYIVGIAGTFEPSGELAMDGIEGTGRIMGSQIHNGYNWDKGQNALSFIEKLEEVTLGYRTFDAMDGTIKRQKVSTIPAATADWTFTEGVDIFRGNASDSVLETRNMVIAEGWNGDKTERTYTAQAANPWLLGSGGSADYQWYLAQKISNAMIESGTAIGGTAGISAREVASWQLAELNRKTDRITLTTPRDDLVEPAQTVCVIAPTRLGAGSANYWVQDVDVSVNRDGGFSQVLTLLGSQDGGAYSEGVTGGIVLTAAAPTITTGVTTEVPTAQMTMAISAPSIVDAGVNIAVVTAQVTADGVAPEVTAS